MEERLDSKKVRGEFVEIVKSTGFMGGIDYILKVSGSIKKISKDLNYIRSEYNRYW